MVNEHGPCVIRPIHFQFRIKIQFRPSTFDLSICISLFRNKIKFIVEKDPIFGTFRFKTLFYAFPFLCYEINKK